MESDGDCEGVREGVPLSGSRPPVWEETVGEGFLSLLSLIPLDFVTVGELSPLPELCVGLARSD